ncbi:hypothetical protein RF11_10777 [Thelohanellus kitauei]|uniref:Uncharacterized protein n=1 Tax=Thelohanellus kitauei TaxID=669202 RepID=A0A0C2MD22_THEKT|nr:hypothetical protein RF11_10777 [Thelohanellus kitauei]
MREFYLRYSKEEHARPHGSHLVSNIFISTPIVSEPRAKENVPFPMQRSRRDGHGVVRKSSHVHAQNSHRSRDRRTPRQQNGRSFPPASSNPFLQSMGSTSNHSSEQYNCDAESINSRLDDLGRQMSEMSDGWVSPTKPQEQPPNRSSSSCYANSSAPQSNNSSYITPPRFCDAYRPPFRQNPENVLVPRFGGDQRSFPPANQYFPNPNYPHTLAPFQDPTKIMGSYKPCEPHPRLVPQMNGSRSMDGSVTSPRILVEVGTAYIGLTFNQDGAMSERPQLMVDMSKFNNPDFFNQVIGQLSRWRQQSQVENSSNFPPGSAGRTNNPMGYFTH